MFIHREKEIQEINDELNKTSRKIVLYGKRRVGKTALLKKIMEERKDCIYFECIQDTLDANLKLLKMILEKALSLPSYVSFESFEQVFEYLDSLKKKYTIIIDEYPYLKKLNNPDTIDSIFQNLFDNYSNSLNFILCGSEINMMDQLLTQGNPLFGRFTKKIYLEELNYLESSSFYENRSIMDKIAFYSVFGGSPFINSFLNKEESLEDNIKRLFLDEQSPVYNYADSLLISDAINHLQAKKIIAFIANGKKRYSEIESHVDIEKTGKIAKSLKSLVAIKLLKKTYPMNKMNDDKKAYYEINDNVLRFFYTYVYGRNSLIVSLGKENFYESYIKESLLTFISHRFKEIVRNYYSLLSRNGTLKGVKNIGTYYYDDSKNKTNGEFDVAIEFNDHIQITEVKYYKNKLTRKEMEKEVEQIKMLKTNFKIQYAFVATSGYEESPYECIDIHSLYDEKILCSC